MWETLDLWTPIFSANFDALKPSYEIIFFNFSAKYSMYTDVNLMIKFTILKLITTYFINNLIKVIISILIYKMLKNNNL